MRLSPHSELLVSNSAKGLDNDSASSASTLPIVGLDCLLREGEDEVVRARILFAVCAKRDKV